MGKKDTLELRVIRDPFQYSTYLQEVERLTRLDPPTGSVEADKLQTLAVLLRDYEGRQFKFENLDAVDAITFRMTEQGLQQRDLATLLNSNSRASEVLNRRRDLSIEQIRVLHNHWGIPAEVLLRQPSAKPKQRIEPSLDVDWDKFPVKEMLRSEWIKPKSKSPDDVRTALRVFFEGVGFSSSPVFLRRTLKGAVDGADAPGIYAWIARILRKSRLERESKPLPIFARGALSEHFLVQVARLSAEKQGPVLAKQFLAVLGISLVVEPALSSSSIDGAAVLDDDGTPVVGLTLRHDRIDAFWFTLLHELAHVQLHLRGATMAFVDDTKDAAEGESDEPEVEANTAAAEAIVPRSIWPRSDAYRSRSESAVVSLANTLRIHPALIAGRIRRESGQYRLLSKLVGQGEVRRLFKDVNWKE